MNKKRIKKFDEFLNESSFPGIGAQQYGLNLSASFGYSDLSQFGSGTEQPIDPNLGFDSYDRHKNNLKDQINRFVQISNSIFKGGSYQNFGYDFISEIHDLYIAKMFLNSNGLLDIYIRFTIEEDLYYGKFEDWGGINEPKFTSKILLHPLLNGYKDNTVRIVGMLKDTLIKWFTPQEDAYYHALKEVRTYDNLGKIHMIPEGGKIKIEDVILRDYKPIIYIDYNEKQYTLTGIEFYFFNWWFKKEEEKEYYL
jgi:hypothetical protein